MDHSSQSRHGQSSKLFTCICKTCKGRWKLHISTIRRHFRLFNNGQKVSYLQLLADERTLNHLDSSQQEAVRRAPASSTVSRVDESASTDNDARLPNQSEAVNEMESLEDDSVCFNPSQISDELTVAQEGPGDIDFSQEQAADDDTVLTVDSLEFSDEEETEMESLQETSDSQSLLYRKREKTRILGSEVYHEGKRTVREVIGEYMEIFVRKSLSKAAFSDILRVTKHNLPQPNLLPETYQQVKNLISDELIHLRKLQVCVNDCVIFVNQEENCPICGAARLKLPDSLGRKYPHRMFSYASLKRSLELLFGSSNIAQVMQAAGGGRLMNFQSIDDITGTPKWKEWTNSNNPANDSSKETKVILGLNTDGVNPFHSQGIQYSCWPLILCIFNIPKHIRNKAEALSLIGVIPSRDQKRHGGNLEPNLQIYVALLVDELLMLASCQMYSEYAKAPIAVKVELLIFMMDFQGYSKFFSMSGANALLPCNICMMKSSRISGASSNKLVLTGHSEYSTGALPRSFQEEVVHRREYNAAPTKSAKREHAKVLGVKGTYPVMNLDYHNRIQATFVDGMHTIKDVICNIMDIILSRKTFDIPELELDSNALHVADQRYLDIIIPKWVDLPRQANMISRPRSLKSHDWKQLVHHRILQYCLRDLFPNEETQTVLFELLECMSLSCSETVVVASWDDTISRLIGALAKFEASFPLLMNVTTHLLIHIAEQMKHYGPLHSTWLFAYERFNSWVSQSIKSRVAPEACIMETYIFFDWLSRQSLENERVLDLDHGFECILVGVQRLQQPTEEMLAAVSIPTENIPTLMASSSLRVKTNTREYCVDENSVVFASDMYHKVSKFIQLPDQIIAEMCPLSSDPHQLVTNDSFIKLTESTELIYIPARCLSRPLVYCKDAQGIYYILTPMNTIS